ncbi:MAG TPA: methyltransferase regulatory domain-containing protein [Lacunisphaera sp.]|nr:methyltransferase regulatory domain-containing protein [Lacunisphaera sp.]
MYEPKNNDYDRVAYPSMAHPRTFAEGLAIRGFMRGLEVAPPDRCRVLELGCGDGFNLAAMAAVYPGSSYTGIDYSAQTVTRGRQMLADMGMAQIRLETADIRALDGLGFEPESFDYIIAHGVYSWVPADVRDALLAVIGRLLAPQGVAFVSYQALPGSYQREAIRSIIRYHTRGETNPEDQVAQSRAILRVIATGARVDNHYTRWIATELEEIEKRADEGLFHDELSAVSHPVLFTEFLAHAAGHGLQFLAEAEYLLPVAPGLTDEAKAKLKQLESNRVLMEQYLDFMEGRRFRQTLLCRPGLGMQLQTSRLDSLWLGCRAYLDAAPTGAINGKEMIEFKFSTESKVTTDNPVEKAVMLTICENSGRARPFPVLFAAIQARMAAEQIPLEPDFEEKVRLFLCRSCLPGLVQFYWSQPPFASTVPARPTTHPLARWMTRNGSEMLLNYSGKKVAVHGATGRKLVTLLDGTRDHAALVTAIREFLATEHEAARARGEVAKLPQPDDPSLQEQLLRGLAGLASLDLLQRE